MKKEYIAPEFDSLDLTSIAMLDVVINPGVNPSDGFADDPDFDAWE